MWYVTSGSGMCGTIPSMVGKGVNLQVLVQILAQPWSKLHQATISRPPLSVCNIAMIQCWAAMFGQQELCISALLYFCQGPRSKSEFMGLLLLDEALRALTPASIVFCHCWERVHVCVLNKPQLSDYCGPVPVAVAISVGDWKQYEQIPAPKSMKGRWRWW